MLNQIKEERERLKFQQSYQSPDQIFNDNQAAQLNNQHRRPDSRQYNQNHNMLPSAGIPRKYGSNIDLNEYDEKIKQQQLQQQITQQLQMIPQQSPYYQKPVDQQQQQHQQPQLNQNLNQTPNFNMYLGQQQLQFMTPNRPYIPKLNLQSDQDVQNIPVDQNNQSFNFKDAWKSSQDMAKHQFFQMQNQYLTMSPQQILMSQEERQKIINQFEEITDFQAQRRDFLKHQQLESASTLQLIEQQQHQVNLKSLKQSQEERMMRFQQLSKQARK
ncbi:UNKNOWN [Stylonychia lemnae]|uniref:Uncharacterized protein n=1 Tax=Stylonychia lemnae TaxID=5949 RepID=A0A078B8W9_STYLE|nr:UNKNOWN [Stylonychia lemnae]|eukprot:CDW89737.1 UNKNOWN [Stylonychia lemnae]